MEAQIWILLSWAIIFSLLQGGGKGGGPTVLFNASSAPYFAVSLNASVLGITGANIQGSIDNSGFSFIIKQNKLDFLASEIACSFSNPLEFSFNCGYEIEIDQQVGPLKLSGSTIALGNIYLKGSFKGNISISINNETISAHISGKISWQEKIWHVPALELNNVKVSSMADFKAKLIDHIMTNAGQIFNDLIKDNAQWAKNVSSKIISGVEDAVKVGGALGDAYSLKYNDVAKTMYDAGYDANDIGIVVKNVFGQSYQEVATVLTSLGFPNTQIAIELKNLKADPKIIIQFFHDEGLKASDITSVMEAAGYPVDLIGGLIDGIFKCSCKVKLGPICISKVICKKCPKFW